MENKDTGVVVFRVIPHTTGILIASGASIRDVSAHLGHAQTSTTMDIYTHALRNAEEKTDAAFDQAMTAARNKA